MKKFILNLYAKQLKRPSGLFGKYLAKKMQQAHYNTYTWIISLIDFNNVKNILEIGYGTGVPLSLIASEHPDINLYGIDFSEVMYNKAIITNKSFIEKEKMFLEFGDVINYSPAVKFDAVYCINVIYFWNDLNKYLSKVSSLLNPGGKFYIYMTSPETLLKLGLGLTDTFNKYSVEDAAAALRQCGFSKTEYVVQPDPKYVSHCLTATK